MDLQKQKYLVIGAILVGVLISIFIFIYISVDPKESVDNKKDGEELIMIPEADLSNLKKPIENKPANAMEPEKNYVKQMAIIFSERFLSYSNQNKNLHIKDVLDMTTPKMGQWVETQSLSLGKDYEGSTARALSAVILVYEEKEAEVELGIKINYISKDGEKDEQKKAKVELLKTDLGWKINGFFWQ